MSTYFQHVQQELARKLEVEDLPLVIRGPDSSQSQPQADADDNSDYESDDEDDILYENLPPLFTLCLSLLHRV